MRDAQPPSRSSGSSFNGNSGILIVTMSVIILMTIANRNALRHGRQAAATTQPTPSKRSARIPANSTTQFVRTVANERRLEWQKAPLHRGVPLQTKIFVQNRELTVKKADTLGITAR
jgi:hypothetical protein